MSTPSPTPGVSLQDEIQRMRKAYPEPLSAVLPALQLAQEQHGGWLPEEALREVADALELTPAYCLSIASFYDMLHTEPVGRHLVEVCTNISCALRGAQGVVDAFERALGVHVGETTGDGNVTLRTVECLGGCGWATVVAVDNRHRLHVQAGDVHGIVKELDGMSTPEIVFGGTDGGALTELPAYEAIGGFAALRRARELTPDQIVEELNASNLRGRGGAFFPTGRKWSFVPKPEQVPKPHYLVVNADESEPGTFKDREIMLRVPFRFLEGCLIAARAIESKHVFVYIRGEYQREWEVLVSALEQMRKAKLLGDVTVVVHRGAGAYICGEETALLESLEGRRGQPRTKPPFPAIAGLYASPTAVNNVESITTVPPIIEMGGAEYAKLGLETSTGTRVFSLSGNVERPGNYELPHGFPLRDLIYEVGGGIPGGRTLKAVIPGGSSTAILTAAEAEKVTLDYDALSQAGTMIGSAAVIVMDDRCCMVQLGVRVSQFYEHESCGKCTPCRVGTRWLTQILEEDRGRAGDARRPRPPARRRRAHQRHVPLPARGLGRDRRRELRREVPRGVPRPHRGGRLPVPRGVLARRDRRADRRPRGARRPCRDPAAARGRRVNKPWTRVVRNAAVAAAKPTRSGVCPARRAGIEPQDSASAESCLAGKR